MTDEPHPYPESRFWRIAPPVTAAILAAIGFLLMLAVPAEPTHPVVPVVVVVLVAQVALMGGRSLYLRRSARVEDPPVRWHQFFFAWSFFAGVTYLLDRDPSTGAATEHIGAACPSRCSSWSFSG